MQNEALMFDLRNEFNRVFHARYAALFARELQGSLICAADVIAMKECTENRKAFAVAITKLARTGDQKPALRVIRRLQRTTQTTN